MNRKITVLLSALLLVLSLSTIAQERLDPKQALRWYPDGVYSRFGLYEAAALRDAEAYAVFEQMFSMSGNSLFGVDAPLGKEFTEKADYFCYAQIINPTDLEMKQKLEAKFEQAVHGKKREEIDKEKVERLARKLRTNFESDRMWVFNIPELDLLVESAVKSGTLARSGKKLLGRPLYSLRSKGNRGEKATGSNTYAWASASGELLVADKPQTILSMVAAGEGGGMRMIDNQEYSTFLGYSGELGQVWNVEARRAEKHLALERLQESGAEEEKIEGLEEEVAQAEIYDVQNFFVTDIIVARSSKVYADEEVAKEKYAQQSGSLRKAAAELKREGKNAIPEEEAEKLSGRERKMVKKALGFAGNLLESQETTIDGTVVTTTITFGKKQLRTLGQLMAFSKMMEKKDREKEEREVQAER